MRSVWIALAAILAVSLIGALLLGRALERTKTRINPTQSLVPRGARVVEEQTLAPAGGIPVQRVVRWRLGGEAEDIASGLYGVTVWQGKRSLYTHRARIGASSVQVEIGDFTGDGHDDLLLFDDTGGSGGCGTYRALATASGRVEQVHVRFLCIDQGSIHLTDNGLLVRLGVRKNPRTAREIHCCYLFVRRTVLRWNGRKLIRVGSSVRRLSGLHPWPPGGYAPGRVA